METPCQNRLGIRYGSVRLCACGEEFSARSILLTLTSLNHSLVPTRVSYHFPIMKTEA